jgi:hypothetical protein
MVLMVDVPAIRLLASGAKAATPRLRLNDMTSVTRSDTIATINNEKENKFIE